MDPAGQQRAQHLMRAATVGVMKGCSAGRWPRKYRARRNSAACGDDVDDFHSYFAKVH